jgi:tRNA 2-selenouridine synthase
MEPFRPIWVEHESMGIGSIYLPDTFRSAMLNGTLFFIDIPKAARIKRLVDEYASFEKQQLQQVLEHIAIHMGSYQSREALLALQNDEFEKVADITLLYYDKLYENSLVRRPVKTVIKIALSSGSVEENAGIILRKAISL